MERTVLCIGANVDGDEVIADTAEAGGFLGACRKFEEFIEERYR